LRASAEFQAVFGEGKRVSGTYLRLQARLHADAELARLGLTVSKRVSKLAVVRNRLRRVLREVFRQQRATLPAGDYMLIAKPEAARADNAALRADLLTLFERARTLKRTTPPGTMPPAPAAGQTPSPAS
jgi:ribonuclease P protein component